MKLTSIFQKIIDKLKYYFQNNSFSQLLKLFFQYDNYSEEVEAIIKQEKPNTIYLHEFKSLFVLNSVYKKNKHLFDNINVVYDAHEIECFRNPPKNFLLRNIIEYLEINYLNKLKSKVVSVSYGIINYYKKKTNQKENVFLIKNLPSVVDFSKYPNYDHIIDIRQKFFKYKNVDDLLGIYVGNITINRGIEEAIKLINEFPNVRLALIGKAINKKYEEKINSLISDSNRIKIYKEVPNHKLVNFIKTADFSIIPTLPITLSYLYSSPNKLHESKAAKLPIFAQDLPEHKIEIKLNSDNQLGKLTNFLDLTVLKTDFEIFLSNLNTYKNNYNYTKDQFFNDQSQINTYKKILDENL